MANNFSNPEKTITTSEILRFIAPVTDMTVKDNDEQDIVTVALSIIEEDTLDAKQYGNDYVTVQVFVYYHHANEDVTTNLLYKECVTTKDYLRKLLARIDVFRQLISIGRRPSATLFADTDTAIDVSIQYNSNRADPYRFEVYDGSNMIFIPVHSGFRIEQCLNNIR